LGVKGGQIVENIGELEFEVVLGNRSFGVVSKCWIPCKIYTNLPILCQLVVLPTRELHTSMGNFPPIQESCPAYAASFLIPLICGSRTFTASRRKASMTSKSCLNISGCWSYLLEMYCLIAVDKARLFVLRKGKKRILLGAD
jgi:hypothetical protein